MFISLSSLSLSPYKTSGMQVRVELVLRAAAVSVNQSYALRNMGSSGSDLSFKNKGSKRGICYNAREESLMIPQRTFHRFLLV